MRVLTRSAPAAVGLVLGAVTLVWGASPSAAAECTTGGSRNVCDGIVVEVSPTGQDTVGGVPVPVDFVVTWVEGGEGDAEGPVDEAGCWAIESVAEGSGDSWAEAQEEQASLGENGGLWGNCDLAEAIDPGMLARLYWQQSAAPPPPTPLQVAPGKALTGLTAYLEIGGEIPHVQTLPTPIGTLTFTMTPRYVVSWGDGGSTGTTSQGGPYPNGDVTHTYVEEGGVTVTVEAYWHSTWTLAGQGGDLPELAVPTSGSLDLPVEQRQAVIDAG